jgi:hypothetical protein
VIAGKVRIKSWGKPVMTVDQAGHLQFGAVPLATGVQARVWYGLILLFANDLTKNVRQCGARYKRGEPCGKYYLKSKGLRVACSERCKRTLRHQQVYRAVKRIRDGRTS